MTADLDRSTRTFTLTLRAIDPVTGWLPANPLLGLLYPDDATDRGKGFAGYSARPKVGLPTGTVITNRASIVFDQNDPIDTPQVHNTLDAAGPASRVTTPSATTPDTALALTWDGADDANGSGIAGYDVFLSVDGGGWFRIVFGTTATSAAFTLEPGHTYAFYSVATDTVGHVEAAPLTPDAVIIIPELNAPPTAAAGGPYSVTYGGTLVLDASGSSDPDDDPLTYSWTVNGHTAATTGVGPTLTWAQLNAPGIAGTGTFTLSVAADDDHGHVVTSPTTTLTITPAPLTITADTQTKVYGTPDPALTFRVIGGNLIGTDAVTGSLTRAVGENVGAYAIGQGSLTAGGNYAITYVGDDLTITPAPITVTADAQTKVYGDSDPALTFQITSGTLVPGDAFSGSLTREPGEDAGTYPIEQGTLTAGDNYDLTYLGADLVITKADQTVYFADLSGRDKTAGTVTLSATSSSGLPVGFRVVSGPAMVSGNVLTITGVGTIVVEASQPGNGNYTPAAMTQAFTVAAASVLGVAFKDFNEDGFVDFGELGVAGVAVTLAGSDYNGVSVALSATTDTSGYYRFDDLLPGTYTVAVAGTVTKVTVGGAVVGSGNNSTTISLAEGMTRDVTFGLVPAAGDALHAGQTAGIGFWHNKNGHALLSSLNGSPGSTQLGDWLAATFPHMFTALAGRSNTQVAAYFDTLFAAKGDKLEAQVLATALSVYVTNRGLAGGSYAIAYGFELTEDGTGVATYDVGADGAAVGKPTGTVMTVMDILLAVDQRSSRTTTDVGFVLYAGDATGRHAALDLFGRLADIGGIQ